MKPKSKAGESYRLACAPATPGGGRKSDGADGIQPLIQAAYNSFCLRLATTHSPYEGACDGGIRHDVVGTHDEMAKARTRHCAADEEAHVPVARHPKGGRLTLYA